MGRMYGRAAAPDPAKGLGHRPRGRAEPGYGRAVHRPSDLLRLLRRAARLDAATVRAMAWTGVALRRTRRELARHGLDGAPVPAPPLLPPHAVRGVGFVLAMASASCLERALLSQRWAAVQGDPSDVVIGVTGPGDGFRAHAWLEAAPDPSVGAYTEILRLPAPAP